MEVFGNYSDYYNLLYQDKDYLREANYIDQLIQRFNPGSITVLDLGCGTGEHDFKLAEKSYIVTGVDQSKSMLSLAREKLAKLDPAHAKSISFHLNDIRELDLGRAFDVVISLFHVLSYQQTNEDLKRAVATAAGHLKPGGIFIFDCWYGPGVLSDPPTVRVKELENERIILARIAEPIIHPDKNLVDVCYHLFVRDKKTQKVEEIRETHTMRYLFKPEVEMIFENVGLEIVSFSEFMGDAVPGPGKWDVCFVGRKK